MAANHEPRPDPIDGPPHLFEPGNTGPVSARQAVITEYLSARVPSFRRLTALRRQGRDRETPEQPFPQPSNDNDQETHERYFNMLARVAAQIQVHTRAFALSDPTPSILDLCMAPGAFVHETLLRNPDAYVRAFTLPPSPNAPPVLFDLASRPNIDLTYGDITLFAGDMHVPPIPANHPLHNLFHHGPYLSASRQYHLLLCDGQPLPSHSPLLLLYTQLALSLPHAAPGGTLLLRLTHIESFPVIVILRAINTFATSLRFFKPRSAHPTSSTAYLVAKGINPAHPALYALVAKSQRFWHAHMVSTASARPDPRDGLDSGIAAAVELLPNPSLQNGVNDAGDDEDVHELLNAFGIPFISLAANIWDIQAHALAQERVLRQFG